MKLSRVGLDNAAHLVGMNSHAKSNIQILKVPKLGEEEWATRWDNMQRRRLT